jgi:hypothetical protein
MARYSIINRTVMVRVGDRVIRGVVVAKDGLNLLILSGISIMNVKLSSITILK